MNTVVGYIIKTNKLHVVLAVPYHFMFPKYSKLTLKYKKYFILDFRKEFKKGDIVLYNIKLNKIYKILKKN